MTSPSPRERTGQHKHKANPTATGAIAGISLLTAATGPVMDVALITNSATGLSPLEGTNRLSTACATGRAPWPVCFTSHLVQTRTATRPPRSLFGPNNREQQCVTRSAALSARRGESSYDKSFIFITSTAVAFPNAPLSPCAFQDDLDLLSVGREGGHFGCRKACLSSCA